MLGSGGCLKLIWVCKCNKMSGVLEIDMWQSSFVEVGCYLSIQSIKGIQQKIIASITGEIGLGK